MIILWMLAMLYVLFAFLLICFVCALIWWAWDMVKRNSGPQERKK